MKNYVIIYSTLNESVAAKTVPASSFTEAVVKFRNGTSHGKLIDVMLAA